MSIFQERNYFLLVFFVSLYPGTLFFLSFMFITVFSPFGHGKDHTALLSGFSPYGHRKYHTLLTGFSPCSHRKDHTTLLPCLLVQNQT